MKNADKLIINAAITGCILDKSDTPHLPITISEIVDCARMVQDEGAAIVHLHARNEDGSPTCDAEIFKELVARVREKCGDLIICVSLSGRFHTDIEKRIAPLASKADLASLTLGSMNFITQASVNSPDTIQFLAEKIYASGAIPELEVFEPGFINYASYLISKELLHPPYYFNILLRSLGSTPLDLMALGYMVNILPDNSTWSVAGIGQFQLDANVMAIAAGGHVRVGLEDCIYYDRKRTVMMDNAQMVKRIARISREMGREPATPAETRKMIGIDIAQQT
jgi:3-keto-5-aminohexanoate cleavage enzyme